MIINMASTSAYDENEVQLEVVAEKGEIIKIGDIITIPMNDHTFEQREITDMYRDWKRGKNLFFEIREGEWANCIIHNIFLEISIQFIRLMRKNCSTMVYKNNRCEYSK